MWRKQVKEAESLKNRVLCGPPCAMWDFLITKWRVLVDSEEKVDSNMDTYENWGQGAMHPPVLPLLAGSIPASLAIHFRTEPYQNY